MCVYLCDVVKKCVFGSKKVCFRFFLVVKKCVFVSSSPAGIRLAEGIQLKDSSIVFQ